MFFNNDTYSPDTIHEEVDKNSSKYAIIWCHFPRTCECWRYRVGIIDKLLYAPGIFFWCLRTIWEQLFPPSWMTILGGLNLQRKKNAHFFRGNNNFYDLTLGVKDNGYLMTNKNIKNPRRSWKDSFFHFFSWGMTIAIPKYQQIFGGNFNLQKIWSEDLPEIYLGSLQPGHWEVSFSRWWFQPNWQIYATIKLDHFPK